MTESDTKPEEEEKAPPLPDEDGFFGFRRPAGLVPEQAAPVEAEPQWSPRKDDSDGAWSQPATPRDFSPAPSREAEAASLPRGWEWSRTSSPAFEPPPGSLLWAASAEAPPAASDLASEPVFELPKTTLGRAGLDVFAVVMALLGGLIGLLGAFFQELQSGAGIFLALLAAPVIEEILKPSGIYLLLLKWPQALRGRLHTALLCAISGAVFGVVESLIYVEVYYPDGSDSFVLFRFTVTPIMHALASFIVGWGLTRRLIDWANGRGSLPKTTRNCFLAGIGLHAVYNTTAVLLSVFGVLDFGD